MFYLKGSQRCLETSYYPEIEKDETKVYYPLKGKAISDSLGV